jgi:phenylacetate-coenzyme A ligase PaaK-like adenylate-forming protein
MALRTYRPDIIHGYPSSLVSLGSVILDKGLDVPGPRQVFTDSVGSFETENIAYECEHHQGCHVATDCVILEILKDGKPVAEGEDGEMVCTVLDNLAMPLVRYNLHDLEGRAI